MQSINMQLALDGVIGYILDYAREMHRPISKKSMRFGVYMDHVNVQLAKHLRTFRPPPETDENYDITLDFVEKSKRFIRYGVVEAQKRLRKEYAHGISEEITEDIDDYIDTLADPINHDPQEAYQMVYQREVVEKTIIAYMQHLTQFETLLFGAYLKGASVSRLRSLLSTENYNDMEEHQISRVINVLKFRLSCFCAHSSVNLYPNWQLLKGLNLFPSLCKKYFGSKKLTTLPDDGLLWEIALRKNEQKANSARSQIPLEDVVFAYDSNARATPSSKKHRFESRKSFDGRIHPTAVVWINENGFAHDVTTREVRDLYKDILLS